MEATQMEEKKVALVTGGAHRIGKAIALALGASGMRLALHYNSSQPEMDATLSEMTALGIQAEAFRADLSSPGSPQTLIDRVITSYGRLDLLVNSAAVMWRTPVMEVTEDAWDSMFAINTRAPFFLSQAAYPHLQQVKGNIINISDLAAFETWPAYVPHGISKAAVVQMTRGLARAFSPDVRVNSIAPGAVLLPDDWSEKDAASLINSTPLARLGSPDDVVSALLYLNSAEFVTGETLIVDGGRHIRK